MSDKTFLAMGILKDGRSEIRVQVSTRFSIEANTTHRRNYTMKCVHYELYSKKTGKLVIKNFGWFDKKTDVKSYLEQHNPKMTVVIVK